MVRDDNDVSDLHAAGIVADCDLATSRFIEGNVRDGTSVGSVISIVSENNLPIAFCRGNLIIRALSNTDSDKTIIIRPIDRPYL